MFVSVASAFLCFVCVLFFCSVLWYFCGYFFFFFCVGLGDAGILRWWMVWFWGGVSCLLLGGWFVFYIFWWGVSFCCGFFWGCCVIVPLLGLVVFLYVGSVCLGGGWILMFACFLVISFFVVGWFGYGLWLLDGCVSGLLCW